MRCVIAILLLVAASPALAEPAQRCDADQLARAGDTAFAEGLTARALASYEAAARCRPSDTVHERVVIVACKLYRETRGETYATKVKLYAAKLPATKRQHALQLCLPGCGGPDGPRPPP